jgi:hypothetical protein
MTVRAIRAFGNGEIGGKSDREPATDELSKMALPIRPIGGIMDGLRIVDGTRRQSRRRLPEVTDALSPQDFEA